MSIMSMKSRPNINPNNPKPFKLQQQGFFDFGGLSTA